MENRMSVLDEAELRVEMRGLVKTGGVKQGNHTFNYLLFAAQILNEIIRETK